MTQPLLAPYQLGSLRLPNRVVMAPMTRNRANNPGNPATPLIAQYYAQRATAGLIISEGNFVSRQGIGFINVPSLYTDPQTESWQQVTDAIHAAGGRIFAQLWHVGAVSHPDLQDGGLPVAPSAINPDSFVAEVAEVSVTDGQLTVHRIVGVIDCGTAVNPDSVRAQMQGCITMGLSAALKEEVTIDQGRVSQSNFHDYGILRMSEAPRIDVHVIQSGGEIGGADEAGLPATAPAVANSVFAATGRRLRSLPLRLSA